MSNQPKIEYRSMAEAALLPWISACRAFVDGPIERISPETEDDKTCNAVLAEIVRRRNLNICGYPVLGVFARPAQSFRQRMFTQVCARMLGKWVSELPLTLRTTHADGSVTTEIV